MLIIAIGLIGKYVLATAFLQHRLSHSVSHCMRMHRLHHEKTSDKSLCMIAMLAKMGAMKESRY